MAVVVQSMWRPAATAPFDRHIALSIAQQGEILLLVFPCRRVADGWIDAETGKHLCIRPTHWRDWYEN